MTIDYGKVNVDTKKGRRQLIGALQHDWMQVQRVGDMLMHARVQEFTNAANFPAEIRTYIEKFHVDVRAVDRAYENAFDILDFKSTKLSGFKIRDVQTGLTFAKVLSGEPAKIFGITGEAADVAMDLYGGGLDWQQTWFDDGEWWTIADNAKEFLSKWWSAKGAVFYDLIQSLTNSAVYNVVYDTVASNVVGKDIATINAGAAELVTAHVATGLGVSPDTQFVLLSPLSMKDRVTRAITGTYQAQTGPAGAAVSSNVTPYFSALLDWITVGDATTGGSDWTGSVLTGGSAVGPLGYLCVPGSKNKIGERMDLTILAETDILRFAKTTVGWGRYGGAISETQWRRLLSG